MRKILFSLTPKLRFVILFSAFIFLPPNDSKAQCGLSNFAEPAGVLNATTTWQSVPVGSATYADFAVSVGNIYSFRYTSNSSNFGNLWDMTFSATSTAIVYNNSLSPVRDSWTGGQGCPNTTQPTSTEWYANFNGTARINTHSFSGGCQGWVNGQSSATLEYKTCPAAADPGFGTNAWNVDAYATTDVTIPNTAARYGYYADASNSFSTAAYSGGSIATAPGWSGCSEIPADNVTVRARRTGFSCDRYKITFNSGDDISRVFINGVLSFSSDVPSGTTTQIADMVLGSADNIEVRQTGLCGPDYINVSVTPQGLSPLNGGVIGGPANGSIVCEGTTFGNYTNVTSASGGTIGLTNGGTAIYDWEVSVDGGVTFLSAGVSTPFWNSVNTVPAGYNFIVRRKVTDRCGSTPAYSNTISVVGKASPNGSMSPVSQTVCPGSSTALTLNFTPGLAPFNVSYTDGVSNFSRTGKISGDTIMVQANTNTNYNFTLITDANGCPRTTSFTSGAQVLVAPGFNLNVTKTNVLCNGGSNGTITVLPNGGQAPFLFSIDGGLTFTSTTGLFTHIGVGTYNIVVKDFNGCTVSYGSPITITEPTPLTQTMASTDASCASVFDGTITVTANGGNTPYSYSLGGGPSQFGSVFTGVASGAYTVDVYDASGCVASGNIVVGNTYSVTLTEVSHTDLTCFGYGDGAATVLLNGGVAQYQYSLNGVPFQPSSTFTGLNAGTYIVVGRDSRGCTASVNVIITQPSPVTVTLDSVQNSLCGGNLNGAVSVTVAGGNPGGYTYNWNNNTYTTEDLTGLGAGIYNLVVTDTKGCSATASTSVTAPTSLFLNIASFNNVLCNGDTSGAIDVTANGGVTPYSYLWNTGATTEDLTNLSGGLYSVVVTDGNQCTQSISKTLTEPSPLTSTIYSVNATCSYNNNGSANLTVGGGTLPYSFLWSNFEVTEDISGLSGGVYHVIITDRNGCQLSDAVTINQAPAIVLATQVTNVSCADSANGAIALTVTGGMPTYTFLWSGGSVPTDQNQTGLPGGNPGLTYTVVVTDAASCTASASAVVVTPTAIGDIYTVTNPLCYGDVTGAINLTAFNGTPTYTFLWSNGPATEDVSGLAGGTYTVTITDSRGCKKTDSVRIVEPAAFSASAILKDITCFGSNDGMILSTAFGGTTPYSYNWIDSTINQNISQSPFIKDRPAGNYYLFVADANNCQAVLNFRLTEPAPLVANVTGTNVSCFGACNGSATVAVSGGRNPYQYLWTSFDTTKTTGGLCAGNASVVVTDSSGCRTFDSVAIAQPNRIVISGVVTDVLCSGVANGRIDLTVTGGVSTYTFLWSNGETTEDIINLAAGIYIVTVTDANLCNETATFTVQALVSLDSTVSVYNPSCYGGNNGFISVDITGGAVPYIYVWNTVPAQNGATAVNLSAGTYLVTVTDANGCSLSISAEVANPDPLVVTAQVVDAKCYNTASGLVIGSATGGHPPYLYILNGVIQISDTFKRLLPGQYVLGVRDVNGCEGTTVFVINAPLPLTVDLYAPQSVILEGMQTQLITTVSAGVIDYYWSPGYDSVYNPNFDFSICGGDSIHCGNPFVAPKTTTVFYVTVMNVDSCLATDTTVITVLHQPSAYIPSAFTPNGDGLNDRFEFDILGAKNIALSVYSRWGDLIYSTDNQTNGVDCRCGWDGTKGGKTLPLDTYVYKMKITHFDDRIEDKAGTVTLMK